jgi:hypothetical protein
MRPSRKSLQGRRGWSTVVGLGMTLSVVVAGQLPATADAAPLAPVNAALSALLPSGAPSAPPAPAPAAVRAPVVPVAVAASAAAAAAPAAVRPAAAKPTAVKPAVKPAAAKPAVAKPAPGLCSGTGWQQRRGAAALATLKGGAARTGFRVEFAPARKGYMGLTHLEERRIEVFVRACGTQSDALLRHVVAHELGHAYDTTRMTTATRHAWMAARGIPAGTDWYGCSGCTDFATPAGDFAEVYAQWARGASSNRSEIAGDVAPARLAQLATQFFGA